MQMIFRSARPVGCLLAVILLAGCSSEASVRSDLLQATTDATAAVRSGLLALQLLDQRRTTTSQAQTVFVDMTRQLTKAEQSVNTLTLDDPAETSSRNQVLAAVQAGSLAVLTGRDCLQTASSCQTASARLQVADRQLDAVAKSLRGVR